MKKLHITLSGFYSELNYLAGLAWTKTTGATIADYKDTSAIYKYLLRKSYTHLLIVDGVF